MRELALALRDYGRAPFPPTISFRDVADTLNCAALELERTTVERERITELFDAAHERTEDPGLHEVLSGIERVLERAVIERDRQLHRAEYLENCAAVQRSREEYARANPQMSEHRGMDWKAARGSQS